MRRRLARNIKIAAATLAVLQISIIGAATAQASTLTYVSVPHQVYPGDYPVCAAPNICLWNEANFQGSLHQDLPVADNHSQWIYFPKESEAGFQPNSLVDNSGSAIYLYDKRDNEWSCVAGGIESNSLLNASFGYFFITYNETDCSTGPPQPLP